MNDTTTAQAASPVLEKPKTAPKTRAIKPAAVVNKAMVTTAAVQPAAKTLPAAKRAINLPAEAPAKATKKTPLKVQASALAKTAVKVGSKPTSKPVAVAPAAVLAKESSPKAAKVKLLRDSFTMPSDEYAALGELKQRALASAHQVKKSELIRAGIKLLKGLNDAALLRALKEVPAIKTGRPKTKKGD